MATTPDIKKILKRNPGIDPEKLAEARKLLESLRKRGLKRPVYNLASPFERRRASPSETSVARTLKPKGTAPPRSPRGA
jgi:hypothetical protein